MRTHSLLLPILLLTIFTSIFAQESNSWVKLSENQTGDRRAPGLIYSPSTKEIIYFAGQRRPSSKTFFPYNFLTYQLEQKKWMNDLPPDIKGITAKEGSIEYIPFKTPYFTLEDKEGNNRLNTEQAPVYHQYAFAKWENKIYFIVSGHFLSYDLNTKKITEMESEIRPLDPQKGFKDNYAWGSLCADELNQEILLFGGKLDNERGDPGTWVFQTKSQKWQNLNPTIQPPVRAVSPMTYSPDSKKIYLFGGYRLDYTYSDTWEYDCQKRIWQELKPSNSPKPRFGHGLHAIPNTNQIVLFGGKSVRSTASYMGPMTQILPFEMWVFDIKSQTWKILNSPNKPTQTYNEPMVSCLIDDNKLMVVSNVMGHGKIPDATFLCTLDLSKTNEEASKEKGCPPGTIENRDKTFDPNYYHVENIKTHVEKQNGIYQNMATNVFIDMEPPVWPERMGGGWSTSSLDTDNDQILVHSGGHSSYYGNDVAHYDLKSGTWSISYVPQFALDYNYDVTGPGHLGFNGAPWGAHNYRAITYDPGIKRLLMVKSTTYFYDPIKKEWPKKEWAVVNEFDPSKYTSLVISTDKGLYCWAKQMGRHKAVVSKFNKTSWKWENIETAGDDLPLPYTDGSGICHDPIRNTIILLTTVPIKGQKENDCGSFWTFDLNNNQVKKVEPKNASKVQMRRSPREAVVHPKSDLMITGYLFEDTEKNQGVLTYDFKDQLWKLAQIPNADIINRGEKPGNSVDLGLIYDNKRDLIWAVNCKLSKGCLRALKIDKNLILKEISE